LAAPVWDPGWGPVVEGVNLLPALLGAIVLGSVAEGIYRGILRPRHLA
jgi:hypothetical protein